MQQPGVVWIGVTVVLSKELKVHLSLHGGKQDEPLGLNPRSNKKQTANKQYIERIFRQIERSVKLLAAACC